MQPPSERQEPKVPDAGLTVPEPNRPLVRALSDHAYHRFQRGLWAVCIAVYLIVFIGGMHAGGADLLAVGRAAAFTLVAALLGRTALGLLGHATAPGEPVPMAVP